MSHEELRLALEDGAVTIIVWLFANGELWFPAEWVKLFGSAPK